jgi:hypothetical protein
MKKICCLEVRASRSREETGSVVCDACLATARRTAVAQHYSRLLLRRGGMRVRRREIRLNIRAETLSHGRQGP